ncbi:hypothetical protein RYH73_01295 [Olivibacter sp. CPCC 100613]|uniref:hypothetical protein n=1 Tax=Olivibacter sp. CPCC 100613 TaxID=3079931 RepID=UPI002FF6F89E
MKKRSTLKYINIDDLKLDTNNPRFGELYNGSTNEDDLIEYLLYEEAGEEIASAIVDKNEFYEDKALWVIKDKEGKYIVRDGNRRCAAVKALQMPSKYKLPLTKMLFGQLPVYEYTDEAELKSRIGEEHAASLFRSWERIAKALQILDLANSGKKDEMNNLDSRPGDFIKLGSFYKEAVKYGGDNFRKQLRRGRGKTGGKTIIYERLFRDAKFCGYKFKNSPSFKIDIIDRNKFKSYIKALVKYIDAYPDLKTSNIDENKDFIKNLKPYGFDADQKPTQTSTPSSPLTHNPQGTSPVSSASPLIPTTSSATTSGASSIPNGSLSSMSTGASMVATSVPAPSTSSTTRPSIKRKPVLKRKKIPLALKKLIDECFDISKDSYPNAKTALTRVTFECTLKYIVENTFWKANKVLKNSNHFRNAFFDNKGTKLVYTNFSTLKNKFTELISETGIKNAFNTFSLELPHQIIHNYLTVAGPANADSICTNLIPLIEFMLRDEKDLLSDLDLSKL